MKDSPDSWVLIKPAPWTLFTRVLIWFPLSRWEGSRNRTQRPAVGRLVCNYYAPRLPIIHFFTTVHQTRVSQHSPGLTRPGQRLAEEPNIHRLTLRTEKRILIGEPPHSTLHSPKSEAIAALSWAARSSASTAATVSGSISHAREYFTHELFHSQWGIVLLFNFEIFNYL